MKKLREQIEAIKATLAGAETKFEVAGNRWEANHDRAHEQHRQAIKAEHDAEHAKNQHHLALAKHEVDKAHRCHYRALKAHMRAEHFVGKAKEYAAEVHGLKESLARKEGKLDALEVKHGPHIDPRDRERVIGGTPKQRIEFAARWSDIHSSLYYSQSGREDIRHGLNGPPSGARYDCSSWFTSIYWSCGLPDPNGHNYERGAVMYTGTLGEHGKPISEHMLDTGDAILYGYAPFHHVEMKIGSIQETHETIGHGTSNTNIGIVALLPGHREFRRFAKD